jgi:hypothetical protein
MDPRKAALLIPVIALVFISGCTSPVCIPFLPFIPCDRVVEYEDDVIVIKSLDALPKTVSPGQQIRLVAYVENVGKDKVPQTDGQNKLSTELANQKIRVNLYDYCEGLFPEVKVICEGNDPKDCKGGLGNVECECEIELLPGQIKEIDWILEAGSQEQIPLKTECDFKVSVTYPYKTASMTDITFIDYSYMQHQINQGTFRERDSYIVSGYGPVKPRITVEDKQPIPVQDNGAGKTVIALRIRDSGSGYLCRLDGSKVVCDSKIPSKYIKIEGIEGDLRYTQGEEATCLFPNGILKEDFATLIKKESPPYICEIELKENVNLPREATEHVTTEIEYLYEFRKEARVTIEPKI